MRVYPGDAIRNVAVVGHGGSGKTSLVDALAFVAGSSKRHGSVPDGTALTDYTQDEIERQYSINLALAYAEWMDTKINLIDTPGYLDFLGDAVAGMHAADAALVTVNATAGVEVGTEKAWELAETQKLPRLFFITAMDKENADFERVFQDIRDHLTDKVVPIEIPVGEGPDFRGIINLFSKKCHMYKSGTKTGEYEETDIPDEHRELFERYSEVLVETVASVDDALIERYLEGKEITREESLAAMHKGVAANTMYPLLCGSSTLTYGLRALLTKIVQIVPAPLERAPIEAQAWGGSSVSAIAPKDDSPFIAQVFKTIAEPHVGEVSLFRVWSGTVNNGADTYNAPRETVEKLNHLSVAQGKERVEVPKLHAGDLGIVAKLKNTHTGDVLSTEAKPFVTSQIAYPPPLIDMSITVTKRGEEDKLGMGLTKLHEEDPTFHHEYVGELRQTIVRGRGERHLDVIVDRLRRKFGVQAELSKPSIAYRETFKGKGDGQGKHKKQSGGRGQYGDCWIRVAPAARGEGFEFINKIVGGVIPSKFIPAVSKGIVEAAERGVVAGFPVVDFTAECYDGSYHAVDSSEQAFKMAGIQAFRKVAPSCKPILLEPVMLVEVWTPDDNLGDVMGDLSSRRGQILGSEPDGRMTKVTAHIPQAEMYKYSTQLHSMTHGRGTFSCVFHSYEEVPADVAKQVAAEREKEES